MVRDKPFNTLSWLNKIVSAILKFDEYYRLTVNPDTEARPIDKVLDFAKVGV